MYASSSDPAHQIRTKWWSFTMLVAMLVSTLGAGLVAQQTSAAPIGQGFTLNASDIRFIRQQIRIAENHVVTRTPSDPCFGLLGLGPNQVEDPTLPFGLRTVDGTCNNLQPGRANFGAADVVFPRLTTPVFRNAEPVPPGFGPATGQSTSYNDAVNSHAAGFGSVFDSEPRTVSNLIVDQTPNNPAAVDAGGPGAPVDPDTQTIFIKNVAPDEGLSAPYNSWFTLFGQFFDHGLDLVTKGGSGTVFVTLKPDDPLFVPGGPNFMAVTRASTQPGGAREGTNTTTPFVDQNQTYTSHPSHQVFLRAYDFSGPTPVPTGKLLDGALAGNIANWSETKAQAAQLGIALVDQDVFNVPLLVTDPYGHFIPGPSGYPQVMFPGNVVVEGNPAAPINVSGALKTGHAFLDDIAHNAVPGAGKTADTDSDISTADQLQPSGTYDNELLDRHFVTGDGRGNENIGLTAVHSVFHLEHNRLVDDIKNKIEVEFGFDAAEIADWQTVNPATGWGYGERLFQAARFVTEMQYQHLVFEEFGRKIQPQINIFAGYETAINSAISAEFAHTVYRFGHSMLTETVDRQLPDGTRDDMDLFDAFLNPVAFNTFDHDNNNATPPVVFDAHVATGSIAQAMTQQVGNEIDEFVTDALRNRLVGLPLDLPAINMARGRSEGIPPLNVARAQFYAASGDSILMPYTSWADFAFNLKNPSSLANFVAAYGTHPIILAETTVAGKRAAVDRIINGTVLPGPDGFAGDNPLTLCTGTNDPVGCDESLDDILPPADSLDFLLSTGSWENVETGLNLIDFWVGGLAEAKAPFGGMLGSTFNYVFETQMERLQDGDRFYYLTRTAGMNLLVQLEGNSFSELIMRNSSARGLPAEVFSRPDYSFNVSKLGTSGAILDDTTTPDWFENQLLTRNIPTLGTIRFGGAEHVNWNGNDPDENVGLPANDRLFSGLGDDTIRLNGGNDWAEGGAGNDQFIGGDGNDILNDSFGDDVIKGGRGNDAIASGQGFDLNQGGLGDDFVVAGSDPTETFGGPGDDVIYAGASADTVFGDDGDDWIEGGGQADLLQGDNGAPFQNDVNAPGNDVIIGDGGNDDYDSEGGDDVMVAGDGIERNEGMLGFDWVTYKSDPIPADADFFFTGLLPPTLEANRDRFDLVEGLSGWNLNDKLRGDERDGAVVVGIEGNFVGHELDTTGIARVQGLAAILPVGATTFANGNIILGGAGSDIMEGRGGNDILDGDRWLNVLLTDGTVFADTLHTFRSRVFAGTLDPGALNIVRRLEIAPAGSDIDTAIFRDARAAYTITRNADGSVTVSHDNAGIDGVDTLWNVEQLQFVDQIVSLVSPAPTLTSISPSSATSGAAGFTLTVNGSNFVAASVVRWNGADRATTFVSPTQLTATIPASDIAAAAANSVTVFTPAPGGGTSAAASFTVANAPVPVLTSLTPNTVTAGSGGFTLTVNGSGFVSTSVVRVNGSDRTTTFVSPTQLTASILASDITTAGTRAITVFSPTPGGGTSGSINLTITATNPVPTITSLNPTSVQARGGATTVLVNGTGFVATSVVRFNGTTALANRPTVFISSTQLQVTISAGDLNIAGGVNRAIRVFSPGPGGGLSGLVNLAITNPGTPTISSITPTTVTAGGPAFTLTVNGTNFATNSVVRTNGANRTTTFVSRTQLTAVIPAGVIATAGTRAITVFTSAPGGGTSAAVTLNVTNAPAPTLTSISPATATLGAGAFTLTVNGSNFVPGSIVRVNGADRATTFVSSSQLTAVVRAADSNALGTRNVTVFSPAPGGGTSTAAVLTVEPAPGATAFVQVGDLDFGARRVGNTRTRTLLITNIGNLPLAISSATVGGPFTVALGTCTTSVNPGRSCRLDVTFTPTAVVASEEQLLIYSNAPGSPAVAIITGSGR